MPKLPKHTTDFINKHAKDVIEATKGTGLFPSVKMAQMIIESSWGQGITVKKANNYFGIKAQNGYKGKKMLFNTPKDGRPTNYFRVYDSALDSIKEHSKFLIENKRYANNGVFTATSPEAQALALQKSGYAEGSDGKGGGYASSLIALINKYHLKALDIESRKEVIDNSLIPILIGLSAGVYLLYRLS